MIDMEEIAVGIFSLVNTSIYPQGMSDGLTENWFRGGRRTRDGFT